MAIPNNISKEHIDKAITEIILKGVPSSRTSFNKFLKINDQMLPPKYIISIANKFANNGLELSPNKFVTTDAINYLKKFNYKIVETNRQEIAKNAMIQLNKKMNNKMGYYTELIKFLNQSETDDLTYTHYLKNFEKLKVRVGFGKGNPAFITWIAFLKEEQSVQQGIYPVYLYYKKEKLLILAYGVSETKKPLINWNLPNPKTIGTYFNENNLGIPKRYKDSFFFKAYNLKQELKEAEVNTDLLKIINFYKDITLEKNEEHLNSEIFNHNNFSLKVKESGFMISDYLSLRFIASLLTKPFVILTGLSGSGKTKLAQTFTMWICEDDSQYCIVPVGADWTNREPLLGFPNALASGQYVKPDNKVLDLIIAANKNTDKPYFLILDEMNLSHVERYFADFLSVMESNEKIPLHPGPDKWDDVPANIYLPKNLFIVGTVNIDETTYMFSPKVLDRANVIEFRITENEMKKFLNESKTLNLKALKSSGSSMAAGFLRIANDHITTADTAEKTNSVLMNFFSELKKTGAEFGYRSAAEIARLITILNSLTKNETRLDGKSINRENDFIDIAIMQKLLPKLHGSRNKLKDRLLTLGSFCIENADIKKDFFESKNEIDFESHPNIKYPLSLEKIIRMYRNAIDNGYTSYTEA